MFGEDFCAVNGMTEFMAIPLLVRFDLLSDHGLIFLNNVIPDDCLKDELFNSALVKEFKATKNMSTATYPHIRGDDKYIEFVYNEGCSKLLKLTIGKLIISGADFEFKLPIINRTI